MLKITGVKCDAEGREWQDSSFQAVGQEEVNSYIDKYLKESCPKCGAPLLTEDDAKTLRSLMAINTISDALTEALVENGSEPELQVFRGSMDGSGSLILKKNDINKLLLWPISILV